MTTRPVFYVDEQGIYREKLVEFEWEKGMDSDVWKRRAIELVYQFSKIYPQYRVLEISTKSWNSLGKACSALLLKDINGVTVESQYQGSKVYSDGGPYTDLYSGSSLDAKRDQRLKDRGKPIKFNHYGIDYDLSPYTSFYNWIYLNSLIIHQDLCDGLMEYDGFTDIHHNSNLGKRNTQASSCAVYVALRRAGLLEQAMKSFEDFKAIVYKPNSIV